MKTQFFDEQTAAQVVVMNRLSVDASQITDAIGFIADYVDLSKKEDGVVCCNLYQDSDTLSNGIPNLFSRQS